MRNQRALSARFFLLGLFVAFLATQTAAQSLPTPEQYLGFRVGTDKKLATWDQVVAYMQMAVRASDRVRFQELGKTTMDHPFVLLTISSPANLARLEEIRANQRRLAYPYTLGEKEAEEIFAKDPAVLLITCTIHSTEIGSTQMTLELVHRLVTEHSPYIENLLDNVVFLLVPSLNPDGQVLVVDWYNKNVGTEYEYSPLPWLYHKYVGHDNNRDAYMLTQVESRLLNRVLYKDWFPLAYLDEHQMGPGGPRIFVPPFEDPVNQNQDPLVIAGSSLLGMRMFTALQSAGYSGAIYGQIFSWWWQGSFKNGGWWHNMIGLLTEVASARIASPVEQQTAQLYQAPRAQGEVGSGDGSGADPRRPLPPPTDTWPRANYPRPWLGGTWTLRNIVDYELVITYALLEGVAANRVMLQRNFYQLNRKAVETGRRGDPFAYVVPPNQWDSGAAARMLEVLDLAGVEIVRATQDFQTDGKTYPKGSYVVPMAQPFRNYAKDLLEPQKYPMKPVPPGQPPQRPYDVTGWTLPFQMGVEAVEIHKRFEAPLERVSPIPMPEGGLAPAAAGTTAKTARIYTLSHAENNSAIAINRLLARSDKGDAGYDVFWTAESAGELPAGTIVVRPKPGKDVAPLLAEIGKQAHAQFRSASARFDGAAWKLRGPRIGLYQPWTGNIDEGWTRWLLEQYEFPYTTLHNEDLARGRLAEKFDVIVFASQSKESILNGNRGEWVRPEYRGGIGEDGARVIEEFVRSGGTLVALDEAADFAIDALGLPVRNVLRGVSADKFFCRGAILQILVDNQSPLGYGMPAKASAYFLSSPAFELLAPFSESRGRAVVRYPATNPLQSGWIGGPEYIEDKLGAVEVSYGRGRVVLLGFRVQFRGQSHATFKLLFNALHWAAATPGRLP